MATSAQVTLLKKIAPEFATQSSESLGDSIDLFSDYLSPEYFGKFYDRALVYFTAHQMTMANASQSDGADDVYLIGGEVMEERLGDAMIRFLPGEKQSTDESFLGKTYYGRMYLQIRSMRRIPAMTRMR